MGAQPAGGYYSYTLIYYMNSSECTGSTIWSPDPGCNYYDHDPTDDCNSYMPGVVMQKYTLVTHCPNGCNGVNCAS